jgi:hypothetical protein
LNISTINNNITTETNDDSIQQIKSKNKGYKPYSRLVSKIKEEKLGKMLDNKNYDTQTYITNKYVESCIETSNNASTLSYINTPKIKNLSCISLEHANFNILDYQNNKVNIKKHNEFKTISHTSISESNNSNFNKNINNSEKKLTIPKPDYNRYRINFNYKHMSEDDVNLKMAEDFIRLKMKKKSIEQKILKPK